VPCYIVATSFPSRCRTLIFELLTAVSAQCHLNTVLRMEESSVMWSGLFLPTPLRTDGTRRCDVFGYQLRGHVWRYSSHSRFWYQVCQRSRFRSLHWASAQHLYDLTLRSLIIHYHGCAKWLRNRLHERLSSCSKSCLSPLMELRRQQECRVWGIGEPRLWENFRALWPFYVSSLAQK
jgi:hypothetical protein